MYIGEKSCHYWQFSSISECRKWWSRPADKNFPEQKQFQGLKRGNPLFLDEEKYQVKTADSELFFFLQFWFQCCKTFFCRRSTRSGWRMRFQWRLRGCTIRTCSFSSTGTNSRYIRSIWTILDRRGGQFWIIIVLVPANSFDSFGEFLEKSAIEHILAAAAHFASSNW